MYTNPTRHKLEEAAYFIAQARQEYASDTLFAFNLSAFLSAARSVTFYLQKQYAKVPAFSEWYANRQAAMMADSELVFLNEARVASIHKTVVPVVSTRAVSAKFSIFVVDPDDPRAAEIRSQKQELVIEAPVTLRRYFPELPEVEVLAYCDAQFAKISAMVQACEALFATPQAPAA